MGITERVRLLAPALTCLLLLGACGGSGSPTLAPPDPQGPFEPPATLDRRLDTDGAGAALSVFPRIAASGDAVYVTWYDRRNGNTDVYLNLSLDRGRSWLAADRRLDTDAPGAAGSNVPQIAADGERVYVVWEDQRSGLSEIRLQRSPDRGGRWLAQDRRLDGGNPVDGSSLEVDIAAAGTRVYVVWQDNRNGAWDVYFNRSLDGGDTWLATDLRLDTDVPGAADSVLPRLAAEGDHVWVVWQDERDGNADIRLNHSLDAGQTWQADDLRLDTDLPGEAPSLRPRIAASAEVVAVLWVDARDGAFDVRANASRDGGTTFFAADRRVETDVPGDADSARCDLVVRGSAIHAVWEDARFGLPDVYVNTSSDGGATWGAQDVRVNTDPPGTSRSIQPVLAVVAGELLVAWADDRAGSFDVLLSSSADAGRTWRARERRMNTYPLGSADALAPALVAPSGQATVVWYDDRAGAADIHVNLSAR